MLADILEVHLQTLPMSIAWTCIDDGNENIARILSAYLSLRIPAPFHKFESFCCRVKFYDHIIKASFLESFSIKCCANVIDLLLAFLSVLITHIFWHAFSHPSLNKKLTLWLECRVHIGFSLQCARCALVSFFIPTKYSQCNDLKHGHICKWSF